MPIIITSETLLKKSETPTLIVWQTCPDLVDGRCGTPGCLLSVDLSSHLAREELRPEGR